MKILRTIAVGIGGMALAASGATAAQAYDAEYTDSGRLDCGDGQVVQLDIKYGGVLGEVHYNITRTHEDVVELPPMRGGGADSQLTLTTWQQSSDWNILIDGYGYADATCVSR